MQLLATRGTASLWPVKNWLFSPPLSVERLSTQSVTNFKAKSLLKQREPQLQCVQKVDYSPLQRVKRRKGESEGQADKPGFLEKLAFLAEEAVSLKPPHTMRDPD